MSCNRTKGYLLKKCLPPYAHQKLVAEIKKNGFSVLCDKATDITINKIFRVSVRYSKENEDGILFPVTRLYRLLNKSV